MRSVIIFVLICAFHLSALAGYGAGSINMSFNTSARANGMGSAGAAVTWGMDTNHWANSALLAFRPGIHYRSFEVELVRDDIRLTNEELTLGAYGVTFLLATGPLPGNFLDMGTHPATDDNGYITGLFDSYMESKSWGLALDGVQVLERILSHEPGTWSRGCLTASQFLW